MKITYLIDYIKTNNKKQFDKFLSNFPIEPSSKSLYSLVYSQSYSNKEKIYYIDKLLEKGVLINNPNKESAYYQTFIYLTNHGEYNYFDYPINKKEFWKQNNAFKVHVIDNHKLNEFQIDMSKKATNAPEYLKYSSENPLILKPTFIITE